MGRNRKPILTKIQDVMGIKSGKYCSSDVSVVSLNGGGRAPQDVSVTYIDCPNRETVTINYGEIQMNNNIIPDCVLGGSVTLNDLNGYVVNYGDTICPVVPDIIKLVQSCSASKPIVINFGSNVVENGLTYNLTFSGSTPPGCYVVQNDDINPIDTVTSTSIGVISCRFCGG
jgi:hypothetical protein